MNVDGSFRNFITRSSLFVLSLQLLATYAAADEERTPAPSLPEASAPDEAPPSETKLLEDRLEELNERLRRSEEARNAAPPLTWNGYVDFGFFAPIGNHGVGWIRDAGNQQFPQYGP